MTASAALNKFWNGFGIDAYPSNSVPKDTTFPWLTYEMRTGYFNDPAANIAVNLWYHTESEAAPNNKAKEIGDAIGLGGIQIKCDDGLIWIKRGSPWCISLTDEADATIKRRQLNVTLEFLTK